MDIVIPVIQEETKKYNDTVIDAPLLFEFKLNEICDITIGVLSSEQTCIERICKRDGINIEKAKERLNNQKDENFFKINCDYCIINEKNDNLEKKIEEILNGKNLSNEKVLHLSCGNIEYLQFRKLLEYSERIEHCYTLKPLDFKIGDKEKVLEEYNTICDLLGLNPKNIYRPHQTHSNNISNITDELPGIHIKELENVDGLITKEKEKILSLVFADCICLYFYDPEKNIIRKYSFRLERYVSRNSKSSCSKIKTRV